MKKLYFITAFLTMYLAGNSTNITITTATDVVIQATSYYNIYNQQTTIIAPGTGFQVYNSLFVNCMPGDTLLIDATANNNGIFSRTPLTFQGITGNVNNPIVVKNMTNKTVLVTKTNNASSYGINFKFCNYIKVSGYENGLSYRLKVGGIISSSGMGIIFDRGTKNVELAHIEIYNTGAQGVQFKSPEPYNGTKTVTDTVYFRQYVNTATLGYGYFHHNYIHHVGSEGFYIGSTSYDVGNGLAITINQSFAESLPNNGIISFNNNSWRFLPHLADSILVYNNIVDSTGWDGIQVACAKSYQVFNNEVSNWGLSKIYNQMFGIIIGAPSIGEVFNNTIKIGNGSAIQCFGIKNRFFNNLIVKPNLDSKEATWWANNAVYLSDKSCTPQVLARLGLTYSQTLFEAMHNTIIMHPNDSGRAISFFQNFKNQTISKCYNNLAVRDANPDSLNSTIATLPNPIFVANPQQVNFSLTNNFVSTDLQTVGFENIANGNYNLVTNCAACRNAQSLTQNVNNLIFNDLNNNSRIIDSVTNTVITNPSFGCYETISEATYLKKKDKIVPTFETNIFPNPISEFQTDELKLIIPNFSNPKNQQMILQLIDLQGKTYQFNLIKSANSTDYKLENINTIGLSKGLYFGQTFLNGELMNRLKLLVK